MNGGVLVTGAGQGIGREICLALVRAGWPVGALDRSAAGAEETASVARGAGGIALPIAADVAREEEVARAMEEMARAFGALHGLVNGAAVVDPAAPTHELSREVWDETLAVDLTGTFLCCKHALRQMLPRGAGRIVNLSSVAGKMPYPFRAAYAAAKAGVISLTRTLALEYGSRGILANAVCPGPVEGERMRRIIAERARAQGRAAEEVEREYRDTTVLGRLVPPGDVAALVVYLLSEAAGRITGQAIEVDAGYLLK